MSFRFKVPSRDVYLPHIDYTVKIRPWKKPPDSISTAKAWTEHKNRSCCIVHLQNREIPPVMAHEFVHVLRHICIDRYMVFDDESEHMAYIMQLLMGKVLNLEYLNINARGTGTSGKRKIQKRSKSKRAAVSTKIFRRKKLKRGAA